VTLTFSNNYPASPPLVQFNYPMPHVNVYSNGEVCLSLIGYNWKPSVTVRQILVGLQTLLDEPNMASAANGPIRNMMGNKARYETHVREFAAKHKDE
jgi:ubiquitin-conjugating enzyme E2 I